MTLGVNMRFIKFSEFRIYSLSLVSKYLGRFPSITTYLTFPSSINFLTFFSGFDNSEFSDFIQNAVRKIINDESVVNEIPEIRNPRISFDGGKTWQKCK